MTTHPSPRWRHRSRMTHSDARKDAFCHPFRASVAQCWVPFPVLQVDPELCVPGEGGGGVPRQGGQEEGLAHPVQQDPQLLITLQNWWGTSTYTTEHTVLSLIFNLKNLRYPHCGVHEYHHTDPSAIIFLWPPWSRYFFNQSINQSTSERNVTNWILYCSLCHKSREEKSTSFVCAEYGGLVPLSARGRQPHEVSLLRPSRGQRGFSLEPFRRTATEQYLNTGCWPGLAIPFLTSRQATTRQHDNTTTY